MCGAALILKVSWFGNKQEGVQKVLPLVGTGVFSTSGAPQSVSCMGLSSKLGWKRNVQAVCRIELKIRAVVVVWSVEMLACLARALSSGLLRRPLRKSTVPGPSIAGRAPWRWQIFGSLQSLQRQTSHRTRGDLFIRLENKVPLSKNVAQSKPSISLQTGGRGRSWIPHCKEYNSQEPSGNIV